MSRFALKVFTFEFSSVLHRILARVLDVSVLSVMDTFESYLMALGNAYTDNLMLLESDYIFGPTGLVGAVSSVGSKFHMYTGDP